METKKNMKKKIGFGCGLALLFCLLSIVFIADKGIVKAAEDPIQEAKNGIVEIYSGFRDNDGEFYKVESSSGFLVYNKENTAYIVTTYNTLKNSEKQVDKVRKEHDVDSDEISEEDVIKVVVTGDVTVDATIFTNSEENNYAILQTGSAIGEKTAIGLGVTEGLVTGNLLYSLGFKEPDEDDDAGNYVAADVEIHEGTIQDTTAMKDGIQYIQHSAQITDGNNGGPIIDETGYVVGVNMEHVTEEDETAYYSLPIEEIIEVLDNFTIPYKSRDNDNLTYQYTSLLEECQKLLEDKRYTNGSKTQLTETISSVTYDLEYSGEDADIQSAIDRLEEAKQQLKLKMKTSRKIVYVLLAVIVFLAIWLIRLLFWKKKEGKKLEISDRNKESDYMKNQALEPAKEFVRETHINTDERKNIPSDYDRVVYQYKEEKDKEDDGTVYLQDTFYRELTEKTMKPRQTEAVIRRNRTGEKAVINKEKFYLGKKEEMNDFVITQNVAVSRKHAYILWENYNYYIVDLGSANGTFVGEKRIEPEKKELLSDGSIITLADEIFTFEIKK